MYCRRANSLICSLNITVNLRVKHNNKEGDRERERISSGQILFIVAGRFP